MYYAVTVKLKFALM